MASTGLLFLMLMSSSFLLYTVTSDDENKLQGEKTLDKAKYIAKGYLPYIEKIITAVNPFMSLIPVPWISPLISLIGLSVSEANKQFNGETSLKDLLNEFDNFNIKLDHYHVEQKWESWASGAYHKPEMNINKAWDMLKTMLHSVKDAKDENEKMRLIEEFMKNYKNHLGDTKELQILLNTKGTSFINPLGDLLAKHVKCHEKDIRQYTFLIHKLIYKGNTMNQIYYNFKKTSSQAKVDEEAKTAYDAASVMFQVHKKCIQNSMDYIQKDVLALIDNKKQRSDIAKEVYSFLVKKYDRYDWIVVAFKNKKSKIPFKTSNRHALTGFTNVTKGDISVAFARQVKGNHTKIDLVKQTIGRCIKDSVSCHEVAQKLSKCTEAMEGKSVTQTYTAVHAYIRKGHASYKTEEEDEIIAATKDQTPPAVYIGKCKKYLGMKTNNFLVLIKSDEEIEKKDLCSKMNCGGKERGKCVKMKDVFLAMCECKMPYYGEDCEESLEDYKKNLKGEIEMEESGSNSVGSGQ